MHWEKYKHDVWKVEISCECGYESTLESQIIGGVGIIGGLDIVRIINNRGVGRG